MPLDLIHNSDISSVMKYVKNIINQMNSDRKMKGLKPRSGRALVIGVPNVGKSTLINRLVGKKKAPTGNTPGLTKALGWIRVNDTLELLDTPGILWPKFDNSMIAYHLAGLSSIKEEIINKEELSIYLLKRLYELYPNYLKERYGITEINQDITKTLDIIATKRGALSKGGVSDYDKVYLIILKDIKEGYIGNITLDRLN